MDDSRLIESIPCNGLNYGTHIDVEVYYTKGGANYFSGRSTQRGYYISAKPVKRDGFMTSTELYSGIKKQLMSANRFSAKQFEKAVLMGKAEAQGLVDMVKKQASVA